LVVARDGIGRSGNTIIGSQSSDGVTWFTVGITTVAMADTYYVGLVACSGDTTHGTVDNSNFDNVNFSVLPIPYENVRVVARTTFTKQSDGSYKATLVLSNSGTDTAYSVVLTSMIVGKASASPIPLTIGDIAPSGTATATLTVPLSAGTSGSAVVERLRGTYIGDVFGVAFRTTLP
jgi:hypothetical protein